MSYIRKLFVIVYLSIFTEGAKILGLLPFFGFSHSTTSLPLFEELARRGHNVTVGGYTKPRSPSSNYKTVTFKPLPEFGTKEFQSAGKFENSDYTTTMGLMVDMVKTYDRIIELNGIMDLLYGDKYDLVIVEYFESDLFQAFVSRLNVPTILFHTCEPFPWHRDALGDPNFPSTIPHAFSKRSVDSMDFWGRFWNTFELLHILLYYRTIVLTDAQRTAEKYLGSLPPLYELTKRSNLYLTNSHFTFFGAKPIHPSTIEVGGIHVLSAKPLSKELNELMVNSTKGVIYFSMGSVLKGSSLGSKKRDDIVKVFSELEETVLWKYEEELPEKHSNIYTSDWFPQRDIFAHRNTALFISHCGLLGIHEAIVESIPVVCIPMFTDQLFNSQNVVRTGIGLSLDYGALDENNFRTIVDMVLRNRTYKDNARKLSKAFQDRPISALDTATFWTEYVIRQKGAPHLISPSRFMSWWQYYNVDVLATLLSIIVTIVFLSFRIVKTAVILMYKLLVKRKLKKC